MVYYPIPRWYLSPPSVYKGLAGKHGLSMTLRTSGNVIVVWNAKNVKTAGLGRRVQV
jgi:hypothetical protein